MSLIKELKKINQSLNEIKLQLKDFDDRLEAIENNNISKNDVGDSDLSRNNVDANPAKGLFHCPHCPPSRKPFLWKQARIKVSKTFDML